VAESIKCSTDGYADACILRRPFVLYLSYEAWVSHQSVTQIQFNIKYTVTGKKMAPLNMSK